jgi:hypothetical protein
MREEYDFSKAERGKFYRPDAELNIPVYSDEDVASFLRNLAAQKGTDVESIVNEWLRQSIRLVTTRCSNVAIVSSGIVAETNGMGFGDAVLLPKADHAAEPECSADAGALARMTRDVNAAVPGKRSCSPTLRSSGAIGVVVHAE